jgi:hypothetical protein
VWSPSRQLPARATPYVHVLRDRHMQHGCDPASDKRGDTDGLTQRQSSPCRDGRSAGSREWTGQSADAAGSAFFRAVHGRWDTCTRYIYIYSLTHSLVPFISPQLSPLRSDILVSRTCRLVETREKTEDLSRPHTFSIDRFRCWFRNETCGWDNRSVQNLRLCPCCCAVAMPPSP